jgi:hypothetical protein
MGGYKVVTSISGLFLFYFRIKARHTLFTKPAAAGAGPCFSLGGVSDVGAVENDRLAPRKERAGK